MKPSGAEIHLKTSVFEHNLKDEDHPGLTLLFGHNVQ